MKSVDSIRILLTSCHTQDSIKINQLEILMNPSQIQSHQTQMPGKSLKGVKNTIAIGSGKGGVGKSTVTVNLAITLAKAGARVGILDADIYGPSIPTMLGQVDPVAFENERYLPVRAHGIQAMSIAYLTKPDNALIWRGPMLAKSLLQMLDLTAWDNLDYLFIDLPPGTGDIQLSLAQKIPLTAAIVVTTPQQVATLDAEKAIVLFEKTGIHVLGLIENMAHYHCPHCQHDSRLFGMGGAEALCKKHRCELLGHLPLEPYVTQDCDRGMPSSLSSNLFSETFDRIAIKVVKAISLRPLNYANRFPPIVIQEK